MKKCLTLPFLFMAFVAFAQPKIHSITSFIVGKENQKRVELFDYQDNGLTVKQQSWQYTRVDSTPRLTGGVNERFSSNKQLISKDYWKNESKWIRYAGRTENKFDNNNCLIEKRFTSLDTNNRENSVRVYTIENNTKCLPIKETVSRYEKFNEKKLELDSFTVQKKYEYDNRDSLMFIRFSYFYKGVVSNGIPPGFIEYKRRPDGKLIEIYEENNCEFCYDLTNNPTRYFIEYNTDNQIVMRKTYTNLGRVNLSIRDSTIFKYNSTGQLSREVNYSFDINGRINFKSIIDSDYDLYCDNLVKSVATQYEVRDSFSSFNGGVYKSIYTYTEGSTCDKKEAIDFTIAPNPAFWQATIRSESLVSADNILTIYNAVGAIVATYKINFRTNTFDFPTLDLINGTYLIRLTNDKNSATKKLVVLH
jgi:hypothetical protein